MENVTKKIPVAISDYITNHFKEDFLFEVRGISEHPGQKVYTVEVSKDNFIYTLKFDENGKLIHEDTTQAYPADMHDESGYDEMPE